MPSMHEKNATIHIATFKFIVVTVVVAVVFVMFLLNFILLLRENKREPRL